MKKHILTAVLTAVFVFSAVSCAQAPESITKGNSTALDSHIAFNTQYIGEDEHTAVSSDEYKEPVFETSAHSENSTSVCDSPNDSKKAETTRAPVTYAPSKTKVPVTCVPSETKAPVTCVPSETKAPVTCTPPETKAPAANSPTRTSVQTESQTRLVPKQTEMPPEQTCAAADITKPEKVYTSEDAPFCGDQMAERGFYNYCPSAVCEDNIYHIFYCANASSGNVRDSIFYNECLVNDGISTYGEKKVVLSPSSDGWDKIHVCDPSVIEGRFVYNGAQYRYILAYLGCDRYNNQHNQIGLAVSESLSGPWIKTAKINPFITADYDNTLNASVFQWGAGQPSLINIDGNGKIACFYTRNDNTRTFTMCEVWDLSNLNAAVKLDEFEVSRAGTKNREQNAETLSNADLAYDEKSKTMYMITDCHPFDSPVDIIADISDIYCVDLRSISDIKALASCTWSKCDSIGAKKTGFDKNHNTGFLRNGYGRLFSNNVLFTAADVDSGSYSLWSYRIYCCSFEKEVKKNV